MLEVNYDYRKGVLFVRVDGVISNQNIYLLCNSIKKIIKLGGMDDTVINLGRAYFSEDNQVVMLVEEIKKISQVHICGYSGRINHDYLLRIGKYVFN